MSCREKKVFLVTWFEEHRFAVWLRITLAIFQIVTRFHRQMKILTVAFSLRFSLKFDQYCFYVVAVVCNSFLQNSNFPWVVTLIGIRLHYQAPFGKGARAPPRSLFSWSRFALRIMNNRKLQETRKLAKLQRIFFFVDHERWFFRDKTTTQFVRINLDHHGQEDK